MSWNPYLTTAENLAFIMDRHEQSREHQEDNSCTGHEIESTPNGQSYGKVGHIPCDHRAIFYYPAHLGLIRTYDSKHGWMTYPA